MTARQDRQGTRPHRRVATALALATVGVGLGLGLGATPAGAQTPPPVDPSIPAIDPATPGPYEPGFVDEPLPTNPPSASLIDVEAESDELDEVEGGLEEAESDRDDAIAHRDELRQHIVDLGEERVAAVDALAQRVTEERQKVAEREAATEQHEERADEAAAAARRLERARDDLRDLTVASYVNASSSQTDEIDIITQNGRVNDAILRLRYSDDAVDARLTDVRRRVRERDAADTAEVLAAQALVAAQQAEDEAVAAREAAEQHIVDIDDETVRTQADEVQAVEDLAEREVDVLLAAAAIAPARLRADVIGEGLDFPLVALDSWVKAAASAPCKVEWWMLAGISKVEGRHGTHGGGRLGARGYPSVKIIGPQLNGGAFANIGDTDGGVYDGDPVYDRAVGPMQFIPSTWARWGRDGDGNGTTDPFTVYDATAGAAAYLCAGRTDLTDEAQLRAAYFSYNHSQAYVEIVLRNARAYQAALPDLPPHIPLDPLTGEPIVAGG